MHLLSWVSVSGCRLREAIKEIYATLSIGPGLGGDMCVWPPATYWGALNRVNGLRKRCAWVCVGFAPDKRVARESPYSILGSLESWVVFYLLEKCVTCGPQTDHNLPACLPGDKRCWWMSLVAGGVARKVK